MTKREKAFVLSLTATIIATFLILVIPLVAILMIPAMIAGLLFMREREASKTGGVIILIMGIIMIGTWVLLIMEKEMEAFFLLIPAVMAIVGGYLGIQGARESEVEKREYLKAFMTSTIGFTSALVSVFVLVWSIVGMAPPTALFGIPFWIISIIINIKRKKGISQKRTKVLITLTWCLIALFGLFLFWLFFHFL